MENPWSFAEKILGIAFCLVTLTLIARSIVDRNETQDQVDDDAEPLYHDRDVVGQTKDWVDIYDSKDKNGLPLSNSNNILLLLAAIIMVWILLRIGLI